MKVEDEAKVVHRMLQIGTILCIAHETIFLMPACRPESVHVVTWAQGDMVTWFQKC